MSENKTNSEKICCSDFYQADYARLLFGNSMHPGGLKLTGDLGQKIWITAGSRVLDVACGVGTSAIFLAKKFGCHVTGIDLGTKNIDEAIQTAAKEGVSPLTEFRVGDAERFDFQDGSFDKIICECSLCLFPDKTRTSEELYRVTRKGGKIGISDIVVRGQLPQNLLDSLYRFVCVLEAKSEKEYADYLAKAGFLKISCVNRRNDLLALLDEIRKRLFAAELFMGLKKAQLGIDLDKTKRILGDLNNCIKSGLLSYALITAEK